MSDVAGEVVEVVSSALKQAEHAPDPDTLMFLSQQPASQPLVAREAVVQAEDGSADASLTFRIPQQPAAHTLNATAHAGSQAAERAQGGGMETNATMHAAADMVEEARVDGARSPGLVPKQLASLHPAKTGSMLSIKKGSLMGSFLTGRVEVQQPASAAPGTAQHSAPSRLHPSETDSAVTRPGAANATGHAKEQDAPRGRPASIAALVAQTSNMQQQGPLNAPHMPQHPNTAPEAAGIAAIPSDVGAQSIALAPKALPQLNSRKQSALASFFGKGTSGALCGEIRSSAKRSVVAGSTPKIEVAGALSREPKSEKGTKAECVVEALKANFALPFAPAGTAKARSQHPESHSAQQEQALEMPHSSDGVDADTPNAGIPTCSLLHFRLHMRLWIVIQKQE